MKSYIQFINHASVLISNGNKSILTDPWYRGSAFDGGWKLIYENENKFIKKILSNVSHIWISHEHPDHFSTQFLKEYEKIIKNLNIKFLFQKTKDGRVVDFLNKNKFYLHEIGRDENIYIDKNFKIRILKYDFYDSALFVYLNNKTIFNLNDCSINDENELKKIKNIYGNCDYLLTQFSYAAWKGGEKNISWRKKSANEKIDTIRKQVDILRPKYLIPFASFVYFSNKLNFYMNDSINTPDKLINVNKKFNCNLVFLAPYEKIYFNNLINKFEGLKFWRKKYLKIKNVRLSSNNIVYKLDIIKREFDKYIHRIYKNNSSFFIYLLSRIKFLNIFQKINFFILDLNISISVDIVKRKIEIISKKETEIAINSHSLFLIFSHDFGFDTLTVNGCFIEIKNNSFIKMAQSLAIGNYNNLGLKFNFLIFLNFKIILLFIKKILELKKKNSYLNIKSLG
jgi:hypothetical protein